MSIARRSLQVLALICTLIIGTASMAVIVTQTTWFKEWLRGFIVRQADDYVNGRLTIGRLDGNLFFGVEMEDVGVTVNGKPVIAMQDVGVAYNVMTFLRGQLVLDHIRLNKPTIHLEKTSHGWNLAGLIKAQTPKPNAPNRRPIEIGEIGISDGTLFVEGEPVGTAGVRVPKEIDRIDASLGVTSDAHELAVDIAHVSLRGTNPGLGINELSGIVRRHSDGITIENLSLRTEETSLRASGSVAGLNSGKPIVDLTASSDKLSMGEMARLLPALRGYESLQPAFEITARGPVDRLEVQLNAREKEIGQASGNLLVDALGPERRIAGTVRTEHFNVGPLVRGSVVKTDISGGGKVNLALPSADLPMSGTYAVKAARVIVAGYEAHDATVTGRIDDRTVRFDATAAAYGGHATAQGMVKMQTPVALDIRGRATGVDLRNLPPQLNAPSVPSSLQFGYTLTGRGPVFSGDLQMDASTLAEAAIAPGTVGSFTIGGGAPTYSARGQVSNLDIQRVGHSFEIPALDAPRFASRLTATAFDVKGSGGGRFPLTLEATATLVDSEMFHATVPHFEVAANLGNGDARVTARGEVMGLDPAVIADNKRVAGKVDGTVDVNVTLRGYAKGVTADSVDASGHVGLTHSTIGGLAIDTAVVDGNYRNRAGDVQQLKIDGPDLHVTAMGPVALNDTGASDLTLHLETPSIDRLAQLAGQSDVKGAATVDAKVTGNGAELTATGTIDGSNVGQGANTVLDLDSMFEVTVPRLTVADATVHAKTEATFLQVAGQRINSLTADTTYSQSKLDFNATAKQGVRQLAAEGSALLHTDHSEVHIGNVALQTENIIWRTDPASHPTIQYGSNRVVVDDIKLLNADQRIEAQGAVGSADDTLHVTANNVDVAQLDALMLGDQRVSGRLNANATVSGTTAAPRVSGDFALLQGAFRNFRFMSFGGKVDYEGKGVTLDVRLDQDAQSWLTAKGLAPVTLFRPTPAALSGEHREPAAGEAVNIQVASSRINLGVIQGFTSYVTNVTGTMEANVTVTGSGYDPHLNGAIDIRGGAFSAPDLGMSYTGLETRIDLTPDAMTINEFKILDDDKNPLTIGGSLAVHERAVGSVDIKVQSDNFKVIKNKVADLKLDTDVHVTGTVRAPKVEGTIEVEPGSIDVAEVLATATQDAYSTTATEIAPVNAAPPEPTAPAVPGIFDNLELRLALAIPGDLLLKGNNIKPASAPIDVGDMNAYVGGSVNITKAPGGKLRLAGEVNTVRGNYTFQGRRFDILRDGRIRFQGSDEIDPLLDLQASRVISGVETFVRVRGTMLKPELSFTSNPPLEEADILSLIVFNMPINELGEGQQVSLATRAQELAGGYLASGLSQSIGSALNLDQFEIQAAGEQGLGPSVTIGQQLGKGVFVRLRQGFGAEEATEFVLEYQLASYLRLQGTASNGGTTQRTAFRRVERGGLDLIFFFSY